MQIFQRNILRKYTESLNPDQIEKSYRQFTNYFLNPERQENIRNSKEEQFQEGFLRELFVNILGYVLNPDPDFNLITEKKNETNSKKADGAILVGGKVVGVIELKDHKTTDLSKVEAQAFNYKSQHKEAKYVVISNFEKLRFFIDNAVDFEEFDLFHLTKDDFARVWICLAYESIVKNLPKQIKAASLNNEDQVTNALYKDYSNFKRDLFEDILKNNPTDNTEHKILLFKKTQKLLDRLLFIFFAEDRDLLPPNSIMLIIEQWEKLKELDEYQPLYSRLKKYFGYMNTGFKGKNYEVFAYNGGLFKPDEILDNLIISDEIFIKYCKKLSDYDFASDVDVNILGHIFENSLTEIEEITTKLQQGEAPTISKRKKDGVFYTPQYITKYIVENTVGKLCREKKAELGIDESEYFTDKKRQLSTKKDLIQKLDAYRDWLLQISICDPACGSGAFLNAALDFLMAEHKLIDEMQAKVAGESIVFPNIESSILENNLYGVDINEESVEIAKLSLWLRTAKPYRKLSSLNNNIKCGNSLIDNPEIAGEKAFCWEKEFPNVFREKKKRPWHITTAVHDSRTSDRMIEYKVRLLRDHGTRPYPEPMLLSEQEEIIITETVAKIVAEDKLNVLAYNICFDHMHLLLVCEKEEVPRIVGKIKSITARTVNIAMGRTIPRAEADRIAGVPMAIATTAVAGTAVATTGRDPLSVPAAESLPDEMPLSVPAESLPEEKPSKKDRTQCSLWTQKFGCTPIRDQQHLYNAIAYIQTNREHHDLPPLDVEYPHCVSIDEAFRTEYTGGFDVVIGNPPYVNAIELKKSYSETAYNFLKNNYIVAKGTVDLYIYFFEKGLSILKSKGLLSFITPNRYLSASYGSELRKFIINEKSFYQLIDYSDKKVFEDASTYPVITFIKNQLNDDYVVCGKFDDNHNLISRDYPTSKLNILDDNILGFLLNDKLAITKKIIEGSVSLSNVGEINATSTAKEADEYAPLIFEQGFGYKLINTGTIDPFFNTWGFKTLTKQGKQYLTPFLPKDSALISTNRHRLYSSPKIIISKIGLSCEAFYDKEGEFASIDTNCIHSFNSDFLPEYVLCWLNSKLYNYTFECLFDGLRMSGGYLLYSAPNLKNTYIKQAPIEKQQFFITLSNQISSLNQQLHQKRHRFIHRLQESLGIQKVTVALERFDEADFKTLLAELKKQKVSLTLIQKDEWEDYFNQYKTDCNALSAQIAATDKQIDQMVYQLYGLTDDEIKVVERE